MRWGACVVGPILYFTFGLSASMWVHMGDLVRSSQWGMFSGAAFALVTQTGWFPITRFVPKRVSFGIGAWYFMYHAFWYHRAVNYSFIDDIEDD